MSSLFFWFVYVILDDVYKVKAVLIMVEDRTTVQHKIHGNLPFQFYLATKSNISIFTTKGIEMPTVNKSSFCLMDF